MQTNQEVKQEEKITQAEVVSTTPATPFATEETLQEKNWRQFREQKEVERKKAEEMAQRAAEKEAEANALKAALEAALNKQPQQNYQGGYEEETEDQRIEKKVNDLLAKRESEAAQRRAAQEAQEMPNKVVARHPDFNQVCTQQNLDYLEYHHPELFRSFKQRNESIELWSDIYGAIKRYIPNATSGSREQAKAQHNLNKPQSVSTPGINPTTTQGIPGRLSEEQKAANWSRMQRDLGKSI